MRLTELLAAEVEFHKLYWQVWSGNFFFIKYQRGRGKGKKKREGRVSESKGKIVVSK